MTDEKREYRPPTVRRIGRVMPFRTTDGKTFQWVVPVDLPAFWDMEEMPKMLMALNEGTILHDVGNKRRRFRLESIGDIPLAYVEVPCPDEDHRKSPNPPLT